MATGRRMEIYGKPMSGPVTARPVEGFSRARRELPQLADVAGVLAVVDAIMAAGDAVIFGATSDGGAVSVTLLQGRERLKRYAADVRELEQLVADLARAYCTS